VNQYVYMSLSLSQLLPMLLLKSPTPGLRLKPFPPHLYLPTWQLQPQDSKSLNVSTTPTLLRYSTDLLQTSTLLIQLAHDYLTLTYQNQQFSAHPLSEFTVSWLDHLTLLALSHAHTCSISKPCQCTFQHPPRI
jgi:hypothetical protein